MKPNVVKSRDNPREEFRLKLLREIKSREDLPQYPDFWGNAETALWRGHPVEFYQVVGYFDGKRSDRIGNILWFPKSLRGGIVFQEDIEELGGAAQWTDAENPLEVLERWVVGELTD